MSGKSKGSKPMPKKTMTMAHAMGKDEHKKKPAGKK